MNIESNEKGFSLIELLIVVAVLGIILAIAVPSYLHAQRAAKAASAVSSLRSIHQAQNSYHTSHAEFGELTDLGNARLIDGQLSAGSKSSYEFEISFPTTASENYEAIATPTVNPTEWHHYFVNASGVIRYSQGATATAASDPIE
jgi:prepilin-type N-terminal cleavage/methylation domain-containing protein